MAYVTIRTLAPTMCSMVVEAESKVPNSYSLLVKYPYCRRSRLGASASGEINTHQHGGSETRPPEESETHEAQ